MIWLMTRKFENADKVDVDDADYEPPPPMTINSKTAMLSLEVGGGAVTVLKQTARVYMVET